jgi:hypothetical protein
MLAARLVHDQTLDWRESVPGRDSPTSIAELPEAEAPPPASDETALTPLDH